MSAIRKLDHRLVVAVTANQEVAHALSETHNSGNVVPDVHWLELLPQCDQHNRDRRHETCRPLTGLKTAWRNTCRRASIHDLRFHNLRREFACRLLESSTDLHDLRDLIGHANVTLLAEYAGSPGVGAGANGRLNRDRRRR